MKKTLREVRATLWDEESGALSEVSSRHPYSNLRTVAVLRAERLAVEDALKLLTTIAHEGVVTPEMRQLAQELIR